MSTIPEELVPTWKRLVEIAEKLTVGDPLNYTFVFRGHENIEWTLEPTLHRAVKNDDPKAPLPPAEELIRIETILLEKFQAVAPNHLPSGTLAVTRLARDWWPLMRHFGVPTRLLDWTASLFVATYFAVSRGPDKDGAVYIVHLNTLARAMKAHHGNAALGPPTNDFEYQEPHSPEILYFTERRIAQVDRMIAQQGVFLMSRNVVSNLEQVLADEMLKFADPAKTTLRKLRIPVAQKPLMMRQLRSMNVTASSLFPGLDGIGRHLDELVRNR